MSSSHSVLDSIEAIIQEDVGARGLRSDPSENLITATAGDFHEAARSLAAIDRGTIGVLTGFFIPTATPPCGETDGPLGAVFLARALTPLGYRVLIYTDGYCVRAVNAGLDAAGLTSNVRVTELPPTFGPVEARGIVAAAGLTHLLALERVGPGHTAESIRGQSDAAPGLLEEFVAEVSEPERDRMRTMRGLDITKLMSPGHLLVEAANVPHSGITTIGIGDGGNEIGMGKIPWRVIRKNIAKGGLIACRIPTQHLIVCGISNWGAYGLGVAVNLLRGKNNLEGLLAEATEANILQTMVVQGPLVDGVLGKQALSVDGLPFDRYIAPFQRFRDLVGALVQG
jgi:hypothetical protein